ncbi:MAG TPA: thioredoxin family protein [Lacipirellulaceae bacterium]|nr:thioredoxin family protein [Lacipirellulaceae bacterium]
MFGLHSPVAWLAVFAAGLSIGCETDSSPQQAIAAEQVISAEMPEAANERHVPSDKLRGAGRANLDFYTVDHYDVARNAAEDLALTITRAQAEKKHILVQVGGDWCGWCHLMSDYIETNDQVREKIRQNYLIMKVTYDGDQKNEAFLSQYPDIPGYPHLFVLDWDGNLLHSQGTAELEEGRGYNDKVYLEFLDKWKPAS